MTIIVSAPLPPDLLERVQAVDSVVQVPAGTPPQEVITDAAKRAEVRGMLCTIKTRVDAALLDAFPQLKVVSNFAVGFDNVPVSLVNERKVLVCNTPGVLDAAVADLTFGFVLNLARNLIPMHLFVQSGTWKTKPAPLASDLAGKRLGILGMGRIGCLVAQRAKAFGMEVSYHNRSRHTAAEQSGLASYMERDELFSQCDYISVHVPLTDATRGSIGKRELDLMKPTAYFINTSRGAAVDEAALIEHLQAGRIAGAGLDVMVQEPLDGASPLCHLPNVMLQPHAGSATVETRRAMIDLATDNLLDALTGTKPKAMVNPEVWVS